MYDNSKTTARELFVNQFKTKKFLIANIFFSVFALLLYADLPISVLLSIGMWRAYFASKPDYATIRFNKSMTFIMMCCVCSVLMLEANVFFWSLQMMAAKDGTSPYLYLLIINAVCSPFFSIFVMWIIFGIIVPRDKLNLKSLRILSTLLSLSFFICAALLLIRAFPLIIAETMLIKKAVMLTFTLTGSISMLIYGINFLIAFKKDS